MSTVVFLLEEPSAKDLLQGIVPRLIGAQHVTQYLVFEGKQDLERQMARKIRGWLVPDSVFVVMRDQDAAPCQRVKEQLVNLVPEAQRDRTLVRVACRELEAWVLGDWRSVGEAYGQPQLAANQRKAAYRQPDLVQRPVDELRKFVPDYQKRDGARRLGPLLDPGQNASTSFRVFCEGLKRLVPPAG